MRHLGTKRHLGIIFETFRDKKTFRDNVLRHIGTKRHLGIIVETYRDKKSFRDNV